jgi:protease I
MNELKGMKVAILITDGFEQVEMVQPGQALNEAGAETSIVSPNQDLERPKAGICLDPR